MRGSFIGAAVAVFVAAGCATAPTVEEELVWPVPPEAPRIRFVRSISSESDVEKKTTGKELSRALLGPELVRKLSKPYGVAADVEGRVYVADTGWGRVLKFDPVANKLDVLGDEGKGALRKPVGVALDKNGNLYVADTDQDRIVVFGPDGKFLSAMGRKGELEQPVG
ncbi:MAG: hypothetical protein HYR98_09050, partial [Nitrospirae bacterium]|nr:hypothetical protein [Nitrospirota bacterium]